MDDTQKMLQAIVNGQSSFRQEVLGKIDKLGRQLAYLEDDTPTREEFDHLGKRVDKISQGIQL